MSIIRQRRPLDIIFHIDTPGVPVGIRYQTDLIETIDGVETVLQSSIETDSQATAADVQKYLGDALASGREEEQAAIARAHAAEAKCESLFAEVDALKEALATEKSKPKSVAGP